MGDREPRRRKKRRDSQKKEDVRSDDIFASSKSELHDSDQETEEEIVIPSHQTSTVSKFVFIILFSGLVVSLSFIFISLQDADKGPVDIFEASHDDHHGEALHDEHLEEALHEDHDDHDDHEEDEVKLEDLIPGISSLGSIFSLNNEQIKETEIPVTHPIPEHVQEEKEIEELRSDTTSEAESSTDQGILEEYLDESTEHYTPDPVLKETSSDIYTEATPVMSYTEDEASYSTLDYSESVDFTTPSSQPDEVDDEPEETPTTPYTDAFDDYAGEESFSFYERSDITNEADFEIRDQLDEVDSGLEKESNDDDDDDDDDEEDDDDNDDYDEDGADDVAQDEFDFWQF